MYILAATWFSNIFREMFYLLDKVVYNFIPQIYDLLISIARTSVLTQGDISQMADRIYKLLAIFMIFKVTLSLITYIVNPDDFSDKSKGVAKLGTNIIISLALLILTPYVFNYAFRLQTIILEDNSLATLVFGTESNDNFLNTAGQDMSFITMSAFFSPNTSLVKLYDCTDLIEVDTKGNRHFNTKCSGLDSSDYEDLGLDDSMRGLVDDKNFTEEDLKDYVRGVEAGSLGLMFRKDMVKATTEDKEYVIDYKYGFSTVVGVVVVLLLVTFCMDVAMRSIKLSFLQLMAPIPIISYVDPKSGKDGLFKKWYQMCFKTFLSLFVRLLALYFAVFIISKVADGKMVDIIDGSYVSNCFISIFIIIGALMFAKQLPKILEGLGIKLDGDGKFFLNPLKKFEEQAAGGKRITGAVGGALAGLPRGQLIRGAARGMSANKGFKGGMSKQADANRKMIESRINGDGFLKRNFYGAASALGLENAGLARQGRKITTDKHNIDLAERNLNAQVNEKENRKKAIKDSIAAEEYVAKKKKTTADSGKALVDFSKSEITGGKAGTISKKSDYLETVRDHLVQDAGKVAENDIKYYRRVKDKNGNMKLQEAVVKKGEVITDEIATEAKGAVGFYQNKQGALEHLEVRLQGKAGYAPTVSADGLDYVRDADGNIEFHEMSEDEKASYDKGHSDFAARYSTYEETAKANGESVETVATEIKSQSDGLATESENIEAKHATAKEEMAKIDKEISELREDTKVMFEGKEITIAEAKRIISEREKEYQDKRSTIKTNVESHNNRRLGGGS